MTRRERLMATLRGEPVDRPAVSFYEIGGFDINPADPDEFNIYNHPSWKPLLDLAEEETDLIRLCGPGGRQRNEKLFQELCNTESYTHERSRYVRTTLRVGGKTLTSLTRRDPDVNTVWTLEHPLKSVVDLDAYLELPDEFFELDLDMAPLMEAEERVGDRGIVMVDTGDALCVAAGLFSMEDYTVIALTEQALFHRLLEKLSRSIQAHTERTAREFPGHLWRICGPEYATEPYLPPSLFREYVNTYTGPMVQAIKRYGGYARIHCHGNIRTALPHIVAMGTDGIDPIEPPPQGNVQLANVRREHGRQLVLFGNIEASDLENLTPAAFEQMVRRALKEGTTGAGRGFVLMPSAAPYGRVLPDQALTNYRTMIRLTTGSA